MLSCSFQFSRNFRVPTQAHAVFVHKCMYGKLFIDNNGTWGLQSSANCEKNIYNAA